MFNIDYTAIFSNISSGFATFLISMIPIAELRGAIPVALTVYKLPIITTFIIAFCGNLLPVVFLLWFLEPFSKFLMKHSRLFNKFFNWLFTRTRKKLFGRSEKYGKFIALMSFVAIPLPWTGAWTGSVAAFIFGIPFKRAFPAIALGVFIAGMIVTLATVGISAIF